MARVAIAECGNGRTIGVYTSSPSSTCRGPSAKLRSFFPIFERSRELVNDGARVAIELSQRTRLSFASIRITWLLLVGSSVQSFAKQTTSWSFIPLMASPLHGARATRDSRRL